MSDQAKPKKESPLKGRRRIKYEEGDWFAVPIGEGIYCLGMVGGKDPQIRSFIGYYFPKTFDSVPTVDDIQGLQSSDAVFISWTGNPGVYSGVWPIIGRQPDFNKHEWS